VARKTLRTSLKKPEVNDATIQLLKSAKPDCIVDGGASDGRYSRELAPHFPDAKFVLVDPIEYPEKWSPPGVRWIHKAMHAPGTPFVEFTQTEDPFRSGVYGGGTKMPTTNLLELVPEKGRTFLKLDTHGVEKEILWPLRELSPRIVALQIEVYCFRLSPTSVMFGEMHTYIESCGYRLATLADALWRGDGCLWQMDFLYFRRDNPVFDREDFFYST
jgi:hypothetical protein